MTLITFFIGFGLIAFELGMGFFILGMLGGGKTMVDGSFIEFYISLVGFCASYVIYII